MLINGYIKGLQYDVDPIRIHHKRISDLSVNFLNEIENLRKLTKLGIERIHRK